MTADLAAWAIAVLVMVPALAVVLGRNLVHCVLWLGVMLLATAGAYVLLEAPFVAAVQVLLYAGGVVVLLIFGVMLTRRHASVIVPAPSGPAWRGLAVAVPLFAIMVAAIYRSPELVRRPDVPALTTAEVGRALVTEHVLSFEVLSLLLLAAMIGAIVIARRRDAGEEATPEARDLVPPRPAEPLGAGKPAQPPEAA